MSNTTIFNQFCKPVGTIEPEVLKDGTPTGKSTINMGFLKYCGYNSKQISDFLEETGYLTTEQAYKREKDLCLDICIFNSLNNDKSMSQAEKWFEEEFAHLNSKTMDDKAQIVHKTNVWFINDYMNLGFSVEEITSYIKDSKRILDELGVDYSKEEEEYEQ